MQRRGGSAAASTPRGWDEEPIAAGEGDSGAWEDAPVPQGAGSPPPAVKVVPSAGGAATGGAGRLSSAVPRSRWEPFMPLIIFLIAAVTRFYRIDVPNQVVFDEAHFGRFTNQLHAGTYFFDIHPPLGKLVFWTITTITGYDYTQCNYKDIGLVYGPTCIYIFMRCTSALFGSATAPILYRIMRNWGGSMPAAFFAALLFITDNLNLGESRLILMDAQLMFWISVCLLVSQTWFRKLNDHDEAEASLYARSGIVYDDLPPETQVAVARDDARFLSVHARMRWLVLIGVMCAMAVSIKWTGLAYPGMIAIECLFAIFFLRKPLKLGEGLIIAGAAFITYATWFFWHFAMLPRTGDGDGFMRIEFQRTLLNNTFYEPDARKPPFLVTFFQLNQEMLLSNARIDQRHPWESVWWEWMVNARGVRYWDRPMGHSYTQVIYLLGNPLVIWLVTASLGVAVILFALHFRVRQLGTSSQPDYIALDRWSPHLRIIGFLFLSYWANMLPYLAVTRSCFAYHYMPALLCGELMTAMLLDALAGQRYMKKAMWCLCLPIVAAFLHFSPWVYAFPLTNDGHARRMWMPRWD